ncbi:MAG: peptidase M48 family protein [Zetaproteobacteria bacterium]|nr:MAG: peptidase M48 family protein [Zetaproteobacteria bacterium]
MASKKIGLSTHIWNNNIRCIALLSFYPVLILGIFWLISYALGVALPYKTADGVNWDAVFLFANRITFEFWPLVLTIVAIWFMIAWFFNTRMIRKLSRSHPVSRKEEPELYNLVENLCISQGMKMPHLEIIETHARNAFASGVTEGNFAVTLTRGLMNSLAKDELEGVIAHELTHIQNRDVRLLIVCVVFTGLFGFLSQLVWSSIRYNLFFSSRRRDRNSAGVLIAIIVIAVILWLGYMATLLMRFSLSRRREYMADAGAIAMTKNPEAMMRALMRISGRDRIPEGTDDIAMMCIENHVPFMGMFATHPPIDQRIKAISEVTNTPIPDAENLAPVKKEESFSSRTRDKSIRKNPWLIRDRRK